MMIYLIYMGIILMNMSILMLLLLHASCSVVHQPHNFSYCITALLA